MRVLIAPDKFKGSLASPEVAAALCDGVASVFPSAIIDCVPVADGGEGLMDAIYYACGGEFHPARVSDPLGRPVEASFLMLPAGETHEKVAVVETSQACGLWRLALGERDPMRLTTRGVGELFLAAARAGATSIWAGIGGSGTSDGGVGMAEALGYKFLDAAGEPISPTPENLKSVVSVQAPASLALPPVTVASDVENPLLGDHGAARVYGPQKGLPIERIADNDAALAHLANLVERDLGRDFKKTQGAGAAGGLGFGLMSFCGAGIRSGFEVVADLTGIENLVAAADWVITGEGSLDEQTLEGKTALGVARLAKKHGKPVIAIGGRVRCEDELNTLFDAVLSIAPGPVSLEDSLRDCAVLLRAAGTRAARLVALGQKLAAAGVNK